MRALLHRPPAFPPARACVRPSSAVAADSIPEEGLSPAGAPPSRRRASARQSVTSGGGTATRRQPRSSLGVVSYHGRNENASDKMSLLGGAAAPKMLQSVRRRLVNTKRGDMPVALRKLYSSGSGGKYARGAASAVFISHTRFATASLPAVNETHPHEWTPFSADSAWVFEDGRFQLVPVTRGIHLTHNGDLDGVHLFGREVGTTELGLWLERVLHVPNSTRGDSPKGAGMLELLCTQGHWGASVRWAYQDCMAAETTDASGGEALSKEAPDTAPTAAWQQAWTALLNEALAQEGSSALLATPIAPGSCRFYSSSVMKYVGYIVQRIQTLVKPAQAKELGLHPDCLLAIPPPPVRFPVCGRSEREGVMRSDCSNIDRRALRLRSPALLPGLPPAPPPGCRCSQANGADARKPKPVGPGGVKLMDPAQLRKFLKRACE